MIPKLVIRCPDVPGERRQVTGVCACPKCGQGSQPVCACMVCREVMARFKVAHSRGIQSLTKDLDLCGIYVSYTYL